MSRLWPLHVAAPVAARRVPEHGFQVCTLLSGERTAAVSDARRITVTMTQS